jgi:hypothetical protein
VCLMYSQLDLFVGFPEIFLETCFMVFLTVETSFPSFHVFIPFQNIYGRVVFHILHNVLGFRLCALWFSGNALLTWQNNIFKNLSKYKVNFKKGQVGVRSVDHDVVGQNL